MNTTSTTQSSTTQWGTTVGSYVYPYMGSGTYPVSSPKTTLKVEDIDIGFQLSDGMKTSIPFKIYIKFVLVHHKLPDDCKDLKELGELVKEIEMIDSL